jgi:alkanesulfonate monooxygenase SsuD/methylene tetrahydromethanopterin reductase-like flavin-dependent oxidoreductase (luciferase family)
VRVDLMIEGQEGVTWDEWCALAAACEQHGIGTLFRSDHYLPLDGHHERGSLDAWATISALGAVTSDVRLGTLVSPATFRHPSELAKVVASADQFSGGRVELGVGTGWHQGEHEAFGFPFRPFAERFTILEEQLQVIAGAWADGPFSFDGEHYSIRELDARPKPVQHPRPNLILGGMGGKRSVALAARFADEYNTVYKTADELRKIRAALDDGCREQGRDPIPLSLMTGWLVGDDPDDLVAQAARLAEWRGHEGDAESFVASVPDGWIVGTVEEANERLDELSAAGVERVMAQHLYHRDLDAVARIGRMSS